VEEVPSDEYAALPLFSPEIKLIIPRRDKKDIPEFFFVLDTGH
jgi:hypothetical protein